MANQTKTAGATPHPARTYTAADFTHAAHRCTVLHRKHPSWPQARVRMVVAWEMEIRTSTLRYLLRQAAGVYLFTPSPSGRGRARAHHVPGAPAQAVTLLGSSRLDASCPITGMLQTAISNRSEADGGGSNSTG
jgi:hypothetical protein